MTDGISEIVVQSVTDLVAAVPDIKSDLGRASADVWWRGHSRWQPSLPVGPTGHWQLVPGVHRQGRGRREVDANWDFVARAPGRYSNCPAGVSADTLPHWLFLMQHYGLPTRILDWTESPLIAAFFAVSEHQENDAAVWTLNPYTLNKIAIGQPGIVIPSSETRGRGLAPVRRRKSARLPAPGAWEGTLFEEAFYRLAPTKSVVAIGAIETDARMVAQLAAFTIHGSDAPLENAPKAASFLRRIVIPASQKSAMREQLEALGLRQSTLFPDLQNLAQELKTRYFGSP